MSDVFSWGQDGTLPGKMNGRAPAYSQLVWEPGGQGGTMGGMDIVAHVMYGVTLCSRTGWAGGRRGPAVRPWFRDPTVWGAAIFSVLPDAVSMGLPLMAYLGGEAGGNFFQSFGGHGLVAYRCMHSMLVAGCVVALLGVWRRRWIIPALAWPVHLLGDAISHPDGKFRTPLLYPLSDWGFDGIPWWQSFPLFATYWAVLIGLWIALVAWRIHVQSAGVRSRTASSSRDDGDSTHG